ncbi:MAG TPA: CocE/NonD family hydrolase [Mycobacteriales bacterium]|nr:CocE/NonD family hydrolase [Mycobacteriales bacterium]
MPTPLLRTRLAALVSIGALGLGWAALPASSAEPLQTGSAFVPRPQSQPLYGTQPPDVDPERQRGRVEAHDGVSLYVETWLPAEKDGRTPPAKVPTVLVMTPYVSQGMEEYPPNDAAEIPGFIEYMTARGYAVAQHHVRGTGESGGCLEQTAASQVDDGARIVEYLGRDAEWTDGNIGTYGISYDAETQISVAGYGDKEKIKYLKAMIPAASVGAQYDWNFMDGVPYTGQAMLGNALYLAGTSAVPGQEPAPQRYPEKFLCQPEVMASGADLHGDKTKYWQDREYRPGAPNVTAATLYVHGLRDFNVQPITIAGWFDRLPETTPHKGLFGVWNHAFPFRHPSVAPDWTRDDWMPMVVAWFDRYLKGLPTGVEDWPDVQVQSSTGQWRAEHEFPSTGGPVGQLSLGLEGILGLPEVDGTTSYVEGPTEEDGRAVFETQPVEAPLHITGQPILDLWLTTDRPDGHIAARIEVLDADGAVIDHGGSGSVQDRANTFGFRSLQHLEEMPDNYFTQERGVPAPTDTPLRVPVRFQPTDLLVPTGGKLRVTIAGTISYTRDSQPSGTLSTITLLHDCEHTSALRFVMPTPGLPLLDVRELDELPGRPLTAAPGVQGIADGGGLATAKVCGKAPERLASFGAPRTATRPQPAPGPPRPAPSRPAAPAPAPAPTAPLPATGLDSLPAIMAALSLAAAGMHARRRREAR